MSFTINDVLAAPEKVAKTATRTFTAAGREWEITIRADGKEDAALFYDLICSLQEAAEACDEAAAASANRETGVSVMTPTGRTVRVSNRAYLSCLMMLTKVSVSPAFTLDEWLLFQDRVGYDVMESVTDWVAESNGVNQHFLSQMGDLKNVLSAPDGEGGSSERALPTSTKPRRKRSGA